MLGTSVLVAGVGGGVSLNSLAVNSIWWVLLWLGVRHDPSGNCDGEGCRAVCSICLSLYGPFSI